MTNLQPYIQLANKEKLLLNLNTPELQDHFNNPLNYTNAILEQFNNRNYYKQFIDENDKIILDLGANVGLFALYATPFAERIVCLEPTPSHYNLLSQLTAGFSNIETMQCAVSPVDGPITFYTEPSNTTMNSLVPRAGHAIVVEGLTLSTIKRRANLSHIDFIKMDIEGSEDLVLNDDGINFITNNIPKILIEFHHNVSDQVGKFTRIFKERGYAVDIFNWDAIMCSRLSIHS